MLKPRAKLHVVKILTLCALTSSPVCLAMDTIATRRLEHDRAILRTEDDVVREKMKLLQRMVQQTKRVSCCERVTDCCHRFLKSLIQERRSN